MALSAGSGAIANTIKGGTQIAATGAKAAATQVPTNFSNGMTVQRIGREIIKWGSGPEDALAVTKNMTRDRANEILTRVTRDEIIKIRDWYGNVADDIGPERLVTTPTPLYRKEMMQRILDLAD